MSMHTACGRAAVGVGFVIVLASRGAQAQQAPSLQDLDAAELRRVRGLTGVELPELPAVTADSPRHDLLFADRILVEQQPASGTQEGVLPPLILDGLLSGDDTGTGFPEAFKYMLPTGYDPLGSPIPLVVAYHGFSTSALGVALQSTIDEECEERGWAYLAPNGLDPAVFGTPDSQQNTAASIQWMLDNFALDPDRIYMVGFSMGGGVVANFVARHRDPEGIMIAALGLVSASLDWTMTHSVSLPPTPSIMQDALNFGGTPAQVPFLYQRSSALVFTVGTYPPLPGSLDEARSMALNLGSTPTFVTWDSGDTVAEILPQNPVLVDLLDELGAEVEIDVVSGTTHPTTGLPAPHSWAVLDEEGLFDFLAHKEVARTPASVQVLADRDEDVSWLQLVQREPESFSRFSASANNVTDALTVVAVENATTITTQGLDSVMSVTPVVDVLADSNDTAGFDLALAGIDGAPSYLLDGVSGSLVTGLDADPFAEVIVLPIGGQQVESVDMVDAGWQALVWSSPDPAPIGSFVSITVDAPTGASNVWLFLGVSELLMSIKGGHKMTLSLLPPTFALGLVLDANGDLLTGGPIPNDPLLQGSRLLLQGVALTPSFDVLTVSNLWSLDIE